MPSTMSWSNMSVWQDSMTSHRTRSATLFARALLAAGIPLTNVADLLGHSSLDTTRIYTKASEADLAAAVSRLENL
ncbi:MAG TPA: tyrosine-type recombinase/integrase [Ktedonobacteraceae bacterium]|nr:tyrosine-type recombinase/integrase [Ktedonobacteraceae bacterium]